MPADSVSQTRDKGTVTVPLGDLVDMEQERARLHGELAQIELNHGRLSKRLEDEQFLSRAPKDVVERERQRLASMDDRRARVEETLSRLGG
jgi:valyl-tRNA synthetase